MGQHESLHSTQPKRQRKSSHILTILNQSISDKLKLNSCIKENTHPLQKCVGRIQDSEWMSYYGHLETLSRFTYYSHWAQIVRYHTKPQLNSHTIDLFNYHN